MGGQACSTHARDKKLIQFFLETLKERNHLGDQGIKGALILERILYI
jgi:hypothetical protein